MSLWIVTISFTAGFLVCIASLVIGMYVYFYTLPIKQIKIPIVYKESPLGMEGWIRISSDILPLSYALEHKAEIANDNWSIVKLYEQSTKYSSFLVNRFLGNDIVTEKKPYRDFYGVLQQKSLFLYSDDSKQEFIKVIMVPHYQITLTPSALTDHELFMPHNPILLTVIPSLFDVPIEAQICIYPPTASEKENWFVLLKRCCSLPIFADSEAQSTFFYDSTPMQNYVESMKKLMKHTGSDQDVSWLNALVGRMFVAIHANQNVKEWVMKRLSRHTHESENEDSFLGDIAIQDIDVGNSLPVLSNPKLVSISVDGDMLIEMDIDYTGGLRIEAATCATLSVPAWDAYMKPLTVPIVVAVKINRFSARVLFKIKPFWETNRIWFGFYRKPELKLELDVEPIISSKLIKIQMVNQVIEQRIKDALESYVMLPNMDDLSFWDFTDLNGSPFKNAESESDVDTFKKGFSRDELVDIAMMGEAIETKFPDKQQYINHYIDNVERHAVEFPEPVVPLFDSLSTRSSETRPFDTVSQVSESPSVVEYLGNAAYSLGNWSRQWGIDQTTKNLVSQVSTLTKPALEFAQEKTLPYTQLVQNQAAVVGLSAIEKLGLKPEDEDEVGSVESVKIKLRPKSSTNWSLLGLSISTSAPQVESPPSAKSRKRYSRLEGVSMERTRSSDSFSRSASVSSVIPGDDDGSDEGIDEDLYMDTSFRLRTRKQSGTSTPRASSP